jgi:hypothetical protein
VAKLSVSLAVAAILAGIAARDRTDALAFDPAASAARHGPQPHLAPGSIGSDEVKDHSLLFQDFKRGEIFSRGQVSDRFVKLDEAAATYLKIADAEQKWLKIDDAAALYLKYDVAAQQYLKIADAATQYAKFGDVYGKQEVDATFLKIDDAHDQFVEGDGSVFTGVGEATDAPVPVLDVPSLVRTVGVPGSGETPPQMQLTNASGARLDYASAAGQGQLQPGEDLNLPLGIDSAPLGTVQLISQTDPQLVATLTISAITAGQQTGVEFTVQALVEGPAPHL